MHCPTSNIRNFFTRINFFQLQTTTYFSKARFGADSAVISSLTNEQRPEHIRIGYRVAQKCKPLPDYQKSVLNRIKACQRDYISSAN